MLHLLTCPRGHSWEADADDGAAVARAVCPVCGDAVEELPLFDLVPSSMAIAAAPQPILPEAPPLRDAAGKPVVAGFEILEDLGRTPLGVHLYRARQVLVNRTVLLKVVVARDDAGQTGWGALRGEAAALGRLHHPSIVPILEAGERERQLFYNAVEWVEGPTLAMHAAGKPLPPRQAALLLEALARAVHAAHEQGVVHRGLRPGCIRLQPMTVGEGKRKPHPAGPPFWQAGASCVLPRIGDFGLARRLVEGDTADLELHDGPPAYLSPEQAWGRGRDIGPASDVYALGAILYELLAGLPPYRGRTAGEILERIRSADAPWLLVVNKRLPADLAAVCRRAMQRRVTNRYKTALELADDLRAFADGRPVRARLTGALERFVKGMRRRPAVTLMFLVCLLAAGAVMTAYLCSAGDAARYQKYLDNMRGRATAAENREKGLRDSLAESQKREQQSAYYHRILLADRALAAGNTPRLREFLESCPAELRHWEWHYLNDRLVHPEHTALTLTGPEQPVTSVAFSPDGEFLAAASGDVGPKHEVLVWRLPLPAPTDVLGDFAGPIRQIAFSADGRRIATAVAGPANDQSGEVKEWEPKGGKQISVRPITGGQPADVAYSADGKRLVVLDGRGAIHSFDVNGQAELPGGTVGGAGFWNTKATRLVLLNPEGTKQAAVAGEGNYVQIYDVQRNAWTPIRAAQHEGDILALAFSPETNLLASADRDGTTQVWDVQANRLVCTLRDHATSVTGVSFTRDGRRLATAGGDGDVCIWDPVTAEEILRLTPFDRDAVGGNGVAALQFSPAKDGWDLATAHGSEVRILGPQRPF